MKILIIRHGETVLNAARVIQHPDTPLSVRGLEQAERLGRHLASRYIDLVIASDYLRARTTAEHVSKHACAPLEINTDLRERNFGDLRGTAYADLGDIDFTADGYETSSSYSSHLPQLPGSPVPEPHAGISEDPSQVRRSTLLLDYF